MMACEIREWARACADECDAERERLVRTVDEGGELPLDRLCLLTQISYACYGLEAVAYSLIQLEAHNNGR